LAVLARRRGFTLIELLVVIAIIGILAAMLFPVFARARESARKIQCLSNVKNIALAVNMYLTDYDRFPPSEHRREAIDAFVNWIGSDRGCGQGPEYRATWGNPFLRWPVILDEYIKNRDVWRCPSAAWDPSDWWIIPNYMGDYLKYLTATHGSGWVSQGSSEGGSPCFWSFPPGWGGSVTDSIAQQAGEVSPSEDPACFSATIGTASTLVDASMSQMGDVGNTVCVADGTTFGMWFRGVGDVLFEMCGTCGAADWVNCPWTVDCHTLDQNLADDWLDPNFRKRYTRHLGGSNIGFVDGHARWWAFQALENAAPVCGEFDGVCYEGCNGNPYTKDRPLRGFCPPDRVIP
jgi:prepilin-type N-terminal cleavage/methylation domain-containing protein/prepilin-type processing-associated H-X9-DG protein